jgi:hypothetical protein
MGLLEDVAKVLERIPIWKRLQAVPGQVDELSQRIAELEEKLGDTWPPDVCKFCGKRAVRMVHCGPPNEKGKSRQDWLCSECNQNEIRLA